MVILALRVYIAHVSGLNMQLPVSSYIQRNYVCISSVAPGLCPLCLKLELLSLTLQPPHWDGMNMIGPIQQLVSKWFFSTLCEFPSEMSTQAASYYQTHIYIIG